MAFNQSEYVTGYIKEKYDRIELKVPKGSKEVLKELAVKLDMRDDKGKISVTRLVVEAIEQVYNVDLSKVE